jgi:hypothetical protein
MVNPANLFLICLDKNNNLRLSEINKSNGLRRILVRLQGASAGAYRICAGGCHAADGPKDKQDVDLFVSDSLTS